MPASFRPKGKAKKIAENILGIRKPTKKKKDESNEYLENWY